MFYPTPHPLQKKSAPEDFWDSLRWKGMHLKWGKRGIAWASILQATGNAFLYMCGREWFFLLMLAANSVFECSFSPTPLFQPGFLAGSSNRRRRKEYILISHHGHYNVPMLQKVWNTALFTLDIGILPKSPSIIMTSLNFQHVCVRVCAVVLYELLEHKMAKGVDDTSWNPSIKTIGKGVWF